MNVRDPLYFPDLNALRALAFLGIFVLHAFPALELSGAGPLARAWENLRSAGHLGIDLFFTLSGFLITYLGLTELGRFNRFDLPRFLLRRILRIWPLYLLICLLGFALVPAVASSLGIEVTLPPVLPFMLFLANFHMHEHGTAFLFFLVFLWSISVEEQFYLLWAVVLKWLARWLLPFCLLLVLVHLVFRAQALEAGRSIYFHSANYLPHFALGALAARAAYRNGAGFQKLVRLPRYMVVLVHTAGLLLIVYRGGLSTQPLFHVLQQALMAAYFTFVLLEQSFLLNSPVKLRRLRWLDHPGRISYGLYCFHGVVITLFMQLPFLRQSLPAPLFPIIVLFATYLLASGSYHGFEQFFLRFKPRPGQATANVGPAMGPS
jgi:peptidoglycan/LPS O-acetylase OafA/YrhL